MLFVDPAFISFEIINSGNFVFSEMRYGAFITQIFPLIASKLGLPLKIVLILYSASFYLIFLSVIYISGQVLKQYKLAIIFSFYLILMVTDVYFWPNNEIHQAVGWMMLFLGLYNWAELKKKQGEVLIHVLMVTFLFFATISHLLIILPLGFLWIFKMLENWEGYKKIPRLVHIYSCIIIGFVGFRYWLSHSSWYDGAKLKGVKNVTSNSLFSALQNDQAQSITHLAFTKYWVLLIIFIVGQILLLYKRKFILSSFTLISALAYFLLVTLTHSTEINGSNLFYFESQWMCWSIILSAPFVFYVFNSIKDTKIIVAVFVFIFLSKAPSLYTSSIKFQKRVDFLESIVADSQSQNKTKSYLKSDKYLELNLESELLMTWGLPVESLLLSSMDSNTPTTTVKLFEKDKQVSIATDSVYTAFKFVHIDKLNSRYFILDKTSVYENLNDYS